MDQALAAQKILVGSVFFFIGSVDRRSNSSSKWVMLYVVFAPMSLSAFNLLVWNVCAAELRFVTV